LGSFRRLIGSVLVFMVAMPALYCCGGVPPYRSGSFTRELRMAMTSRPTHVPTDEALSLELAWLEYWLKN
jgi:hypothetical protein